MDTIKNYLDSIFSTFPNTEEVQKAKTQMAEMMEDKYLELKAEGKSENEAIGIVISEFGNIDEVRRELGIPEAETETEKNPRIITIKEAKDYLDVVREAANQIGKGVMLCILSPVLLIFLASLSDIGKVSETMAASLGLLALFCMIIPAVALFIVNGMKLSKYDYMQHEEFILQSGGFSLFREMKEAERMPFTKNITIGVVLIILSIVPVVVVGTLVEDNSMMVIYTVLILLAIVAFSVNMIINAGLPYGCFDIILQQGEYSVKKKGNKVLEAITAIYWPVVTAIYLAYSFITFNWGSSWIIWPVAGVIFGGISAVFSVVSKNQPKQ
ncbi:MAG: permease prefix domain 1-containing protein [Eubacteriales bacterium]|nr:permease prefix domain 1-containing protein [Eubacteriales bacterium]